MSKTSLSRIIGFTGILLLAHSAAWAQSVTVYNAAELAQAIADANAGTITEIIIDARGSGGTLALNSSDDYTFRNAVACEIKALPGTSVVINGGGHSGLELIKTNSTYNVNQNISLSNIVITNSTGIASVNNSTPSTEQKTEIGIHGDQGLVFSQNADGVFRSRDSAATAQSSTITIDNQGSLVFQDNQSSSGGGVIDSELIQGGSSSFGIRSVTKHYFSNAGDVVFHGNKALTGTSGGAIKNYATGNWVDGSQYFTNQGNVIFSENTAAQFGGAIYNHNEQFGSHARQDFINNGSVAFYNNHAGDSGGAFYHRMDMDGGNVVTTFKNKGLVDISGNTAQIHGGAIYGYANVPIVPSSPIGGVISMDFLNSGNVIFSNNRAITGNGGVFSHWGNNSGDQNYITFSNSGDVLFLNNHAGGDGGANFSTSVHPNSWMGFRFTNVGNVLFSGNTAIGNGGAISNACTTYSFGLSGLAMQGNVLFENNLSGAYGGAIYLHDDNVAGTKTTMSFVPKTGYTVEFKNNWQNVLGLGTSALDFSQARSNAIYMVGEGNRLDLRPESGASILFRDPIQTVTKNPGENAINMTGLGTVRLWNGVDNAGSSEFGNIAPAILGGTVTLNSGRFLAMDNAIYSNAASTNLYFTVNNNATLGVSVDQQGGHSVIDADTFTFNDNPELYVSGISAVYEGPSRVYEEVIKSDAAINGTGDVNRMLIDNKYMKAYFDKMSNHRVDLVVERVNDMSTLYGDSAGFLDQMRKSPYLPEELRWMFDDIYNYGDMGDDFVDIFSTLSGKPLLNSFNALRANGILFHQKMISRLADVNIRAGEYTCCPKDYIIRDGKQINADNLWGDFTYDRIEHSTSELFGAGYHYKPLFFTFGRDRRHRTWKTGYAFEYVHGKTFSGRNSYSNVQLDTASGGIYAGRNFGKMYFKGTAQVGVGWSKANTHYAPVDAHAKASYNTATLGTGFELGRVIRLGCVTHPWEFTPHIGAEYLFIHGERFIESGAGYLNRSFGQVNYNTLDLPFGFRVSKQFNMENGLFTLIHPNIDLMYVRSVADNVPKAMVSFKDAPLCVWDGYGLAMGRDAFRMNAGVTAKLVGDWDLNFNYGLEARNHYSSQQFSLALGKSW